MELLVAAIIFLTFISIAYKFGTGEAILKIRIAEDIGLIIEDMYSISDDIDTYIIYPEDASKFDITIKDNIVSVSSEVNDITSGNYKFVGNSNYPPIDLTIERPKTLYIGKTDGDIIITKDKPDLKKMRCDEIEKPVINSILIDSGIDETGNINKAELANSFAFYLINKLSRDYEVKHARNDINRLDTPLPSFTSILTHEMIGKDAIIGINIGETPDNSNNIVIYHSPDSARKEEVRALSCIILNNIIEEFDEFTTIAIVPKEEFILDNDKISMIIEIGNFANTDSLDLIKKPSTIDSITSTIHGALKDEII